MEKLKNALEELKIEYREETLSKFEKYMEKVLEWNEKVNLTAIKDKDEFVQKHFIDSVLCAGYEEIEKAQTIIDVGTGAGFPGVPLAIIYPEKQFVLMDSLAKRLKIVKEICDELGILNVEVLHGRAEELARKKEHREVYDLCVSRAVANLATLSEYCLPFVKVGGYFYAYKGRDAENELAQGKTAVKVLGGSLKEMREAGLKGFELEHKILCIEKVKATTSKFPRKPGTPAKEPIK